MQERQILATHQEHVQYKDGVQFTSRIHALIIPPIDRLITHITDQTARFAAHLHNTFCHLEQSVPHTLSLLVRICAVYRCLFAGNPPSPLPPSNEMEISAPLI